MGLLSACDAILDPAERQVAPATVGMQAAAARPEKPEPPSFVTRTPVYPATVIYILYREYLHKNPGLTSLSPEDPKYQQHLEKRLRQLYPNRGYPGMVKDAVEEAREHRQAWAEYRKKQDAWLQYVGEGCSGGAVFDPETGQPCPGYGDGSTTSDVDPSWDGQEEFPVPDDSFIPTLQMEIDSLQMTQPEIDRLYYQESLADGSFFERRDELIITSTGKRATLDDLIRAAGDGWMPSSTTPKGGQEVVIQVEPATIAVIVVSVGIIGWKGFRIVQAGQRARAKSVEFWGYLPEANSRRDAYRHIFWNMQNNRYVGGTLAKMVGDLYESIGGNAPAGKVMDLHNNTIGREVKYRSFRGHWLWDRWDWNEWAEKVRMYTVHLSNAEYISEWETQPPPSTESEAWARASLVPNWKYIYFAL